jgi:hypothetical protein
MINHSALLTYGLFEAHFRLITSNEREMCQNYWVNKKPTQRVFSNHYFD